MTPIAVKTDLGQVRVLLGPLLGVRLQLVEAPETRLRLPSSTSNVTVSVAWLPGREYVAVTDVASVQRV